MIIDTTAPAGALELTTSESLVAQTGANLSEPAAARLADGNTAIAYTDAANDDIKLAIVGLDGTVIASGLPANTETAGTQGNPAIAALDTGGFVVVWETDDPN